MRECEEKLKTMHSRRASKLDLTTGSRLISRQRWHTCEACRGAEESPAVALQDKTFSLARQLARDSNS